MKIKTIPLKWYTDPAHGWLRVSRKDCERLGILDQISSYSYESRYGHILYLEEDNDAQVLLKALEQSTQYLPQYSIDKHVNTASRIRSLHRYQRTVTDIVCNRWESMFVVLDKIETYAKTLWKHYRIPRPDDDHPWNYELYCEVLENAEAWLADHSGLTVYWDNQGNLIATNDRARASKDLTEKYNKIRLSQENAR